MEPISTTCLISNFNYARYVGDAIDAALRQTEAFDQIVVVDDGSTDDSLALLAEQYGQHPLVSIVSKANGGQLSCFNEGFAHATGDIVFFLDADDVYEPNYVEQALELYRRDAACDFLFCGRRLFGQMERPSLKYPRDRDFGYSVIRTVYSHEWIGEATSCLSMRRHILEKILPLPFIDEWRVRADDCLVFGASLAGARKRYLAKPLVRYRVHGQNHFYGREADRLETFRRRLAINRLLEHLERRLCINVPRLAEYAHREFRTLDQPTIRQFASCAGIAMRARVPLFRRLTCVAEMAWHYLGNVWRPLPGKPTEAPSLLDHDGILPIRSPAAEEGTVALDAESFSRNLRRAA